MYCGGTSLGNGRLLLITLVKGTSRHAHVPSATAVAERGVCWHLAPGRTARRECPREACSGVTVFLGGAVSVWQGRRLRKQHSAFARPLWTASGCEAQSRGCPKAARTSSIGSFNEVKGTEATAEPCVRLQGPGLEVELV